MVLTRGREFLDSKVRDLMAAGYGVDILRHDSVLWGLPQRRRRVFLVGTKVDLDWVPPKFTGPMPFAEAVIGLKDHGLVYMMPRQYTAAWRLAVKRRLAGKSGSLRRAWFDLNPGLHRGSPRMTTGVIHPDQPIGTLIGKTQLHYEVPRYLSEGEMKRLMGLPDGFRFWQPDPPNPNYLGVLASEVARAVNPVIGAYLARTVAAGLARGRQATRGARLISADAVGKGADLTMRWKEEEYVPG
jgi:site-specific DNA-cytosine methylase